MELTSESIEFLRPQLYLINRFKNFFGHILESNYNAVCEGLSNHNYFETIHNALFLLDESLKMAQQQNRTVPNTGESLGSQFEKASASFNFGYYLLSCDPKILWRLIYVFIVQASIIACSPCVDQALPQKLRELLEFKAPADDILFYFTSIAPFIFFNVKDVLAAMESLVNHFQENNYEIQNYKSELLLLSRFDASIVVDEDSLAHHMNLILDSIDIFC